MTRTSLLLTALLVVSAATAGLSGAVATNGEPATNSAAAYQTQVDGATERPVTSGEVFWQGQLLQFTAGEDNASEVWSVRQVQNGEVGGLVTEVLLDGNGSATFPTAGLDGQFVIVDEQERPVVFDGGEAQRTGNVSAASFEVADQTLDATFEDATVRNDDHPDARTDLQLESNRAGYQVALFSEQLDASQLAEIFPAAEERDDRAVVTRNVSGDEVVDANFTGVEPGTYNVTVVAADGTAEDTATITVVEPVEGSAGLSNATYAEERGDVVEFNVTLDGTDTATVDLGSQDIGYHARFAVTDENDDGVVTVRLDTYRAGQSESAPGVSVVGEDNLTDARLLTDPLSDRLDAASYAIEVSVGATRTAVGAVQLTERTTGGMQIWTAPEDASVDTIGELTESGAEDDDVAYQDWAIVQVEASGLYAYVQNVSDLNNETTGVSASVIRVGEMNRPSEEISLDPAELVVDEEGNRMFLVLPTNGLEAGSDYRAHFNVTDANPYVEEGNGTSLVANFSVVERDVSFDQPIEVSASSDAAVTGSSSLAPGTELQVEISNTEDNPFLRRSSASVGSEGNWRATFDLSGVPAGTNFTVDVTDPEANATGVVVSGEATAEGTTTETTAAETTEDETATAEETAEAGAEETATETTTDEGEGDAGDGGADEGDAGAADGEDDAGAADGEDDAGAADGEETTAADGADGAGADDAGADDAGADDAGADEDGEAADAETTGDVVDAADGGTTTAEVTTTDGEAGTAPASGFGPVAVGAALAVLLGVGMLAVRRS